MTTPQSTIATLTPNSCIGSGPFYTVTYAKPDPWTWGQKGSDIDGEASHGDKFGWSVSLSNDGSIVAIGDPNNSGGLTNNIGHVRVYEYNSGTSDWDQKGDDIDGGGINDYSGRSVSLSDDGLTLAIGFVGDNSFGARVEVYEWNAGTEAWDQKGADIDCEYPGDLDGDIPVKDFVSLNSDGSIVAIGAYLNDDGPGSNAGNVRVYEYSVGSWSQKGADIDGEGDNDQSGCSVSLNGSGDIVAIGAYGNDRTSVPCVDTTLGTLPSGIELLVNGSPVSVFYDDSFTATAPPYFWLDDGGSNEVGFTINDGTPPDVIVHDYRSGGTCGATIASGDYTTGPLAFNYSSGVCSFQMINSGMPSGLPFCCDGDPTSDQGHVRVYEYDSGTSSWGQKGSDIDGESAGDSSGWSVSLSDDGLTVAIGAPDNDDGGSSAGHVRVYEWNSGTSAWDQKGDDIDGEATGDESGFSVSLSDDGSLVAIGARHNDGGATDAGHVRVYEYQSCSGWVQKGSDIDDDEITDWSGWSVSLASDGSIRPEQYHLAIGSPTFSDTGHVKVYQKTGPRDSSSIQVGDWAYVNHEEVGNDGNVLSVYTYRVTEIVDSNTLTLKWISATNGYVDDSPCDLSDGTGSSGSCGIASHVFKRDLSSAGVAFFQYIE